MTIEKETTPAYITRCRGCKAVVGAVVDDQTHLGDMAAFIADEIRANRIVERTTVGTARVLFGECTCQEETAL